MATHTTTTPSVRTRTTRPHIVVLYNDDVHPFDAVVFQVQKATGKSEPASFQVALVAHIRGKSVAFTGSLAKCQQVAAVLRTICLQVEVDEP